MSKADIRTYTKEIIETMIRNNKAVIRSDELIDRVLLHVNLTDVPEEEKDRALISQQVYPLMAEQNWVSVIRRSGYYINMEMCSNPHYFEQIINNSNLDIQAKQKALEKREKFRNAHCDVIPGQLTFNFDTGTIEEEKTIMEILEMLARDAV